MCLVPSHLYLQMSELEKEGQGWSINYIKWRCHWNKCFAKMIGTSGGFSFGCSSGGWLATLLVATFSVYFPPLVSTPFFLCVIYMSDRGSVPIKNSFLQNFIVEPKNPKVNPFPDPVGHIEAPGSHFGFWNQCVILGMPPVPLSWYFLQN